MFGSDKLNKYVCIVMNLRYVILSRHVIVILYNKDYDLLYDLAVGMHVPHFH